MTAQIHDRIQWQGEDYLLVGVSGEPLFDPTEYGLVCQPTTTANWRGWAARYAIRGDLLMLLELHDVGLAAVQHDDPPMIEGVRPERDGYKFTYPELNLSIAFTGRLLIARGFIQSLYRHMGFHPAWKFEESWEFDLDQGHVTKSNDTSEEMAELRKKIRKGKVADPDDVTRPGWIARTFTLEFRRSKGD